MKKINQIWAELENDKSFSKGLLLRRYSGSVLPDVYVAVQHPEKMLCICISISDSIEINISLFATGFVFNKKIPPKNAVAPKKLGV